MRIDKRMLDGIPAWLERQDDIPSGWLYIGDEKERYILGQPGRRNMLVFGVNPRHPLYLKGDSEFQWFPVFDYACECRDGDIW